MRKFTDKMKNMTCAAAGVLTAVSLAAAPLAVNLSTYAKEIQPQYQTQTCSVSMDTDEEGYPIFYPGEYITNDSGETAYLVFINPTTGDYIIVTVPAGDDYELLYTESVSGTSVSTPSYWICVESEDNGYYFVPNA